MGTIFFGAATLRGGPAAFLAGAFLAGAFLAGAFLAGAFLAGAFLTGAFLTGAFFAGAFFAGTFLAAARFAGAFAAPLRRTSPASFFAGAFEPRATGLARFAAFADALVGAAAGRDLVDRGIGFLPCSPERGPAQ
ncbi:MAG: hypothetical protein ACR2LQ_00460 [Acidimicrobiales bacterium]